MFQEVSFEYKGMKYVTETEYEDDRVVIYHRVQFANGAQSMIDWSGYSTMSQLEFELWIDLGRPDRIGMGPLKLSDLLFLASKEQMI